MVFSHTYLSLAIVCLSSLVTDRKKRLGRMDFPLGILLNVVHAFPFRERRVAAQVMQAFTRDCCQVARDVRTTFQLPLADGLVIHLPHSN